MIRKTSLSSLSLAAILIAVPLTAHAQPAPAPAPAPAKQKDNKKAEPLEAVYDEGFVLRSADKSFALKIGGYVQIDARLFAGDDDEKLPEQFLGRRIRPTFEATVFEYFDVRLMPDFGGGRAVVQDAYIDVHPVPWARLRVGKMKAPFGLERLQSATALFFVERGLPTNLVPNRDFGVQLHGEVAEGVLSYGFGLFDGVPDGGSADGDISDDKDLVGRVFVRPLKATPVKLLHDVGFGFAASWGERFGTLEATELPQYRTPGQAGFFAYRTGETLEETSVAEGKNVRLGPQGYAYVGPAGVLFEYVRSTQRVRRGAIAAEVGVWSWQIAGSVVLTGEKASYKGVTPDRPVGRGGFGAVEIAARYGELNPGEAAFQGNFADYEKAADHARAWAFGLNYHANRNVKLQLDYERTTFAGGAKDGERPAESAFLGRLQLVF